MNAAELIEQADNLYEKGYYKLALTTLEELETLVPNGMKVIRKWVNKRLVVCKEKVEEEQKEILNNTYKIPSNMGGVFIVKIIGEIDNEHVMVQPVKNENDPEWHNNKWSVLKRELKENDPTKLYHDQPFLFNKES
jgi:hypothetical protein